MFLIPTLKSHCLKDMNYFLGTSGLLHMWAEQVQVARENLQERDLGGDPGNWKDRHAQKRKGPQGHR